jgi:hypothetical protein
LRFDEGAKHGIDASLIPAPLPAKSYQNIFIQAQSDRSVGSGQTIRAPDQSAGVLIGASVSSEAARSI